VRRPDTIGSSDEYRVSATCRSIFITAARAHTHTHVDAEASEAGDDEDDAVACHTVSSKDRKK